MPVISKRWDNNRLNVSNLSLVLKSVNDVEKIYSMERYWIFQEKHCGSSQKRRIIHVRRQQVMWKDSWRSQVPALPQKHSAAAFLCQRNISLNKSIQAQRHHIPYQASRRKPSQSHAICLVSFIRDKRQSFSNMFSFVVSTGSLGNMKTIVAVVVVVDHCHFFKKNQISSVVIVFVLHALILHLESGQLFQ